MAPPEAAVGVGEQRLGAEISSAARSASPSAAWRVRRAERSSATPSITGPKQQRLAALVGLHRPAVDAQPDGRPAVGGADRELDGEGRAVVEIDARRCSAAGQMSSSGIER